MSQDATTESTEVASKIPQKVLDDNVLEQMMRDSPENVSMAVFLLHRRAKSMMKRATTVLFVVIAVLVFTAVFIVFAGKIAQIGVSPIDPMAEMKSDREDVEERILFLREEIENNNTWLSRLRAELNMIDAPKAAVALQSDRGGDAELDNEEDFRISELQARIAERNAANELSAKELEKMFDRRKLLDGEIRSSRSVLLGGISGVGEGSGFLETFADPKLVLAAGLTRLGVLIVAIYLVQILINLYRYNTRVAAHYLASAEGVGLVWQT